MSRLPSELVDYIAFLTPGIVDRKEAEAIREELMDERSLFREEVDGLIFGHVSPTLRGLVILNFKDFNMCEH